MSDLAHGELDAEAAHQIIESLKLTRDAKFGQDAAQPAPPEAHEPGDNHQYEIACKVCGERGVIRLTVDPERAAWAP